MIKKLFLIFFFVFIILNVYSLKIVWWNVDNLFDTIDDPDKQDTVLSEVDYKNKIDLLSKKIMEIDVDIVGLAEIENINVLKDIAEISKYPYYYLEEGNDPRGIDVCLMSRIKLQYKSHRDQPTPYKENTRYKFSRDCPEAVFSYEGKEIYFLINHLKSKVGDDDKSLKKRIAQSKGILDIIADIYNANSGEPYIIVAGDFNSERYSEPLNILQKSGLVILNYLYKEKVTKTYKYRGEYLDLDYIILNKPLYEKVKIRKFKSFIDDEIEKIGDHYPLIMEIEIRR